MDVIDSHERINIEPDDPWYAEHRSRYEFAAQHIGQGRILDIACGSGMGADVISGPGRIVIGVDFSEEAAQSARSRGAAGYHVVRADGIKLPLQTGSIDAITCFETVEHISEDRRFIAELRRVIREDGLMILSTPNALVTKPLDGIPKNPFHVREYTPTELESLLLDEFSSVVLRGQRTSADYGVCPYWDGRQRSHRSLSDRATSVVWKAISRLPGRAKDRSSEWILRRPLYPTSTDFEFDAESIHEGHVILALCRP